MTTRGEYRVGIDFNPSGNKDVNDIKELAAQAIDLIEDLEDHGDSEIVRLKALAMTHAEDAAMWAVKAATKKPWGDVDAEQNEETGENDGGSGS